MSKQKTNLGYLGHTFQIKLLNQIIVDESFASSIIDILDPSYFDNEHLRLISAEIKNYYDEYQTIPLLDTIEQIINQNVNKEITRDFVLETLQEIKKVEQKDAPHIQKTANKFCKQQELKKAHKKIEKILESGDFERYDECVEILKKAISVGDHKDQGVDVFDAIEDVLSDDFRDPIPTGIKGLDNLMGGGLSKGELAVILAAFGVGKTTMITKIGNSAYDHGKNVVQIFFEDNPKVIQRKHFTCWSGIELNELSNNKEKVIESVSKVREGKTNHLILKKFPSSGTNMSHIEQYLRKLISEGIRPDIVLLDYIDCVVPTRHFDDEYAGEGDVMRQFETMIAELNVAGWTAIQGNRSAIGASVVDGGMIGGSIKKGQIGHFVVSVAKTLQQKEDGRATMAILKSRFSKDGIVMEDIIYNNASLVIDTTQTSNVSFVEFGKHEEQKKTDRVVAALEKRNYLKNKVE
jgi:replicative DNA helicase